MRSDCGLRRRGGEVAQERGGGGREEVDDVEATEGGGRWCEDACLPDEEVPNSSHLSCKRTRERNLKTEPVSVHLVRFSLSGLVNSCFVACY